MMRRLVPDPDFSRFSSVDTAAAARLRQRLVREGVAHEVREHERARHARHLASIWEAALPEAGRATLFYADGQSVLVVVPADRKVSAPLLRDVLRVTELRVLRGDRGVGRLGWHDMPGEPGVLPAVPQTFGAILWVDKRILALPRVIVALEPSWSLTIAPQDFVRVTDAKVARIIGQTRLLPEGGMVTERDSQ